jgi:DNA-binding PadR family transcriptional regulator
MDLFSGTLNKMERDKRLPLTETVYYVLMALLEPSHGYRIMQRVEGLSGGAVRMAAGTLYGALDNLLREGYIEPVASQGARRKVYQITGLGREVLLKDTARMEHRIRVLKEEMKRGEKA